MAFNYTPEAVTDEPRAFKPWPAGEYDFEIIAAEEQTSKAGNPMIKLRLKLFNNEGNERTVFDYIMPSVAYKLKHFCETVGFDYENPGWEAADAVGRGGRLKLTIQKGTEAYPDDKNSVQDYLPDTSAAGDPRPLNEILGEDAPF